MQPAILTFETSTEKNCIFEQDLMGCIFRFGLVLFVHRCMKNTAAAAKAVARQRRYVNRALQLNINGSSKCTADTLGLPIEQLVLSVCLEDSWSGQ
jgi:hypothetical protein